MKTFVDENIREFYLLNFIHKKLLSCSFTKVFINKSFQLNSIHNHPLNLNPGLSLKIELRFKYNIPLDYSPPQPVPLPPLQYASHPPSV